MIGALILFFLLIVGGFFACLMMFVSADGAARDTHVARQQLVEQMATEHGLIHALAAGDVIVGVSESNRALFYKLADEPHLWLPLDRIASVALTPVYQRWDEMTATTTTSRGSQLVGAGMGFAIAGPIGAVIGGTTASRQTVSTMTHSETLCALELEMRVRGSRKPRLLLDIPASPERRKRSAGVGSSHQGPCGPSRYHCPGSAKQTDGR